jgi:YegS/Rv2252/BmrU family lipid kinase
MAAEIIEKQITEIVICGGDGSVNQVVQGLSKLGLSFGIIPQGSGNGLAFAAGIPKDPELALELVFNNQAMMCDAFTINDKFACMLAGMGFDADVAHQFSVSRERGLKTYASLTTKQFIEAKPYSFRITANNFTFNTDAFFMSIANSNQFGNNFTIAPKAKLNDGMLDIVIVKKSAKPLLIANMIRQLLFGKITKVENSIENPIIYFQTDNIVIENEQMAALHIDGEPVESLKNLSIKVLPSYFKLINGL